MNDQFDDEKIRKMLIKQKEDFKKWKKDQGDSDIIFNEKDKKEK